jgi:hypothetical protein
MAKKKIKRTPLTFARVVKVIALGVVCILLFLAAVSKVWHYWHKHLN